MSASALLTLDTRAPQPTLGAARRDSARLTIAYELDEPTLLAAAIDGVGPLTITPTVLARTGPAPTSGLIVLTTRDQVGNQATVTRPYVEQPALVQRLLSAVRGVLAGVTRGVLVRPSRGRVS